MFGTTRATRHRLIHVGIRRHAVHDVGHRHALLATAADASNARARVGSTVGGRCMRATHSGPPGYCPGDTLAVGVPSVGCPGCHCAPCAPKRMCVDVHVVNSAHTNAVSWHAERAKLAGPTSRGKSHRVVCLLALVIQACANDALWAWFSDYRLLLGGTKIDHGGLRAALRWRDSASDRHGH